MENQNQNVAETPPDPADGHVDTSRQSSSQTTVHPDASVTLLGTITPEESGFLYPPRSSSEGSEQGAAYPLTHAQGARALLETRFASGSPIEATYQAGTSALQSESEVLLPLGFGGILGGSNLEMGSSGFMFSLVSSPRDEGQLVYISDTFNESPGINNVQAGPSEWHGLEDSSDDEEPPREPSTSRIRRRSLSTSMLPTVITEYSTSFKRSESFQQLLCRICHGSAISVGGLESPCFCKGSVAYVHLSCLERWLMESNTTRCELCGYQYTVKRVLKYSALRGFWVWVTSGRRNFHVRRLYNDLLYILFLAPMLSLSCYLLYSAWTLRKETNLRAVLFFMIVLGIWINAYFLQMVYSLRFYYPIWHTWWLTHYYTRIVLDPPEVRERRRREVASNPAARFAVLQPMYTYGLAIAGGSRRQSAQT